MIYLCVTPPDPQPDCYCGAVVGLAGRCEKCDTALCELCVRRCAICQAPFCAKHLTVTCTPEQGVVRACAFCADLAWRAERTQALRCAERYVYGALAHDLAGDESIEYWPVLDTNDEEAFDVLTEHLTELDGQRWGVPRLFLEGVLTYLKGERFTASGQTFAEFCRSEMDETMEGLKR